MLHFVSRSSNVPTLPLPRSSVAWPMPWLARARRVGRRTPWQLGFGRSQRRNVGTTSFTDFLQTCGSCKIENVTKIVTPTPVPKNSIWALEILEQPLRSWHRLRQPWSRSIPCWTSLRGPAAMQERSQNERCENMSCQTKLKSKLNVEWRCFTLFLFFREIKCKCKVLHGVFRAFGCFGPFGPFGPFGLYQFFAPGWAKGFAWAIPGLRAQRSHGRDHCGD